ncbi:hypothetical protein MTP99_019093 [Tenebrio molitor]|nr:hypothetical protein MTP99_019093 [Tenebrio molitor]
MHTSCSTSPTLEIRTPLGAVTVLSRSTPHRRDRYRGGARVSPGYADSGCRRQHTPPPHSAQTSPEAQLQPHCLRARLRNQPP